jgi:hypothetical protein
VRRQLISDIDELSNRTQQVGRLFTGVGDYAKRHKKPLIVASAGLALVSVALFSWQRARAERKERRRLWSQIALGLAGVQPPPPKAPGILGRSLAALGNMLVAATVNEVRERLTRLSEPARDGSREAPAHANP